MIKTRSLHKKSFLKTPQQVAFVFFLLFTLAPCKVRASFLQSFSIEYSKPLNKTKIAQGFNGSCQTDLTSLNQSQTNSQQIKVKHLSSLDYQTFVLNLSESKVFISKRHPISTSGNSPPLYILYKRFKFDLA